MGEYGLTERTPPDTEARLEPAELTILVVDDEPVNILLLEMILKARGFQVHTAVDGSEAVQRFEETPCDLVLMDIMMPGMDGYEATRRIKARAEGRFVPVLFVTALTDEKRMAECIACGGDDFLTKPISRVQLNAKIDSWLRTQAMHRAIQNQHAQLIRYQQRLDMEQHLARRIVAKAVTSPVLEAPGFRHYYQPAEILSGDLLLASCTPAGRLVVTLGDFTGHGIAAAIGVIPFHNIFRSMIRKGFSPGEMLREANERMTEALPPEMFLAALTLELDPVSRTVTVWNSAMPPLLVLSREGEVRHRVASRQLPLGIDASGSPVREAPVMLELEAGDRLFLCSDGVVEAGGEEEFGLERIEALLRDSVPDERVQAIEAALSRHLGHELPARDDVTFVELDCDRLLADTHYCCEACQVEWPEAEWVEADERSWGLSLALNAPLLRQVNPLPLLLNIVERLHGRLDKRQSVYIVLAELYSNALEHGLLGLDSQIKNSEQGFARYYLEREQRLEQLEEGDIRVELRGDDELLWIRIEDSGRGFAYERLQEALAAESSDGGQSGDEADAEDDAVSMSPSGRGMKLVRALCERVRWHGAGNSVEAAFRW